MPVYLHISSSSCYLVSHLKLSSSPQGFATFVSTCSTCAVQAKPEQAVRCGEPADETSTGRVSQRRDGRKVDIISRRHPMPSLLPLLDHHPYPPPPSPGLQRPP